MPGAAAYNAPPRFSFDEFEAWHEPGDWVTPAQVDDAAHDAADAIAKPLPTPRTPCRPLATP